MFRPFIVPLTIAALLIVGGVVIAIQPIVDPGYLHPLGLLLTGMFFTVCGVVFTAVCIGFAFSEKRDREFNARVAAARETHLYGTAGWGEPVNVAYLGDGTVAVCDEACDWMCPHASDRANVRPIGAVSGVSVWS